MRYRLYMNGHPSPRVKLNDDDDEDCSTRGDAHSKSGARESPPAEAASAPRAKKGPAHKGLTPARKSKKKNFCQRLHVRCIVYSACPEHCRRGGQEESTQIGF